jgi:hypothetical protein
MMRSSKNGILNRRRFKKDLRGLNISSPYE